MRVWLENAYSFPFYLGGLAEPRHLSHKAQVSIARFELGVGTRKKEGHEKVTKELYFTYLWRSSRGMMCI